MKILITTVVIIILQTLASGAMSQEMADILAPSPISPIRTASGVRGSVQCTKNSDESYAVCATFSNTAVKYNLQPFSFAAKGPTNGDYMYSCDLYDTSSQSTSRAVCVKSGNPSGVVFFHRVSDMINVTNVTIGGAAGYPHVIVDTQNQVAYASNFNTPPAIYKITNIGSPAPVFAATLNAAATFPSFITNLIPFGSDNAYPAAMLIIHGFLYVHLHMDPARLARISIATFTWAKTVTFASGELGGSVDNLANDENYIYDLTYSGILVRCTYNHNNFARFDKINTGISYTNSLAISPDSSFLLITTDAPGIIVVNTSSFSVESRALLPNPVTPGYVGAQGRPIILSKNKGKFYPACAFSHSNDYLYTFNVSRVPFREVYPIISPLSSSPIDTASGVHGSLQCTKNSDESYAVCASKSNTAVKYNLQPFSFAAKGPDHGDYMISCDLYETDSQTTSRAVCVKSGNPSGLVYFHRVSGMAVTATVSIGVIGNYPRVIVDTQKRIAYVSNFNTPPAIYKIVNIGSPAPVFAGNRTSFDFGDSRPATMLIIDGFLYVHFSMNPASRLARINITRFKWNQTINFTSGETGGGYDNLANDDNFIYDLTHNGILVRCTYKNNNFARFDSLNTGLSNTHSLAIAPDQRTLFVVSNGNQVLQLVDVSSFSMFGNPVSVSNAFGRPIVTSTNIYVFRETSGSVNAFLFSNHFDPWEFMVSGVCALIFVFYLIGKARAPSSPFVKDKLYQIDFGANGITPPADPNAFGTLIKIPSKNNSALFRHVKNELWSKLGTFLHSQNPVADFTLESIEVIYADIATLEGRMRRLKKLRSQNGNFFNPPTGTFTALQLEILGALRDQFLPRPSNATEKNPNLINVFHGTKVDHLHSVVNGLVAVRSTDAGYFGSGVYTTTSIEYAAKYARGDFDTNNGPYPPRASDGCFPVVWCVAAVGVCYPLTREVDYSRNRVHGGMNVSDFFGAPLTPGYDCHCVAVNESVGFQAVSRDKMQYMEVVFDQEVQVLPIAVLWVKPI